jgi:hypothetical protein
MPLAAQLANFTTLTPPKLSREDSAAARERNKGAQQRAEDFIYTLNHAITCLSLTDFIIAPFFSSVFGWNICGHDHSDKKSTAGGGGEHQHYPGCGHEVNLSKFEGSSGGEATLRGESTRGAAMKSITPEALRAQAQTSAADDLARLRKALEDKRFNLPSAASPADEFVGPPRPPHLPETPYQYTHHTPPMPTPNTFGQRLSAWWKELRTSPLAYLKKQYPGFKEWAIGEAVGDIGAVPLTLAVQHFTPGVMEGIQRGVEPIVGGLMRRRAERAAERWADKHGIARDAEDVVTRARELYQYEIRHLPQMVMWTISSCLINYGVMKARNPAMELGTFAKGKVAGAAITAGLVFGARTLAPDKAHKWDSTVGSKVVVPITKTIGRVFGIDPKEIDEVQKRQQAVEEGHATSWVTRVKPAADAMPQGVRQVV